MKLRNKILVGFSGVLAIVLILIVVQAMSLDRMGRLSRAVESVDGGMTDMLVAQGHILRFALYRDQAFVPQARESLGAAVTKSELALTLLTHQDNLAGLQRQIATLKEIDATLTGAMLSHEKSRLEVEVALRPVTVNLEKMLIELRTLIGVNEVGVTPEGLAHYAETVDCYNQFMKARLAARVYTMTSTPENERAAIETLKETQEWILKLSKLALQPAGVDLVKKIGSEFTHYSDLFRNLVVISGQIQQDNIKVRDLFVGGLKECLKIAANATDTLLQTSESSVMMLYVGAVVVFLVLLGIAIVLMRNVQSQLGMDPGELGVLAARVTNGDYDIDNGNPRIGVYGNLIAMVAALKENIQNAKLESEKAHQESVRAQQAMQSAESSSQEAQSKTKAMLVAADRLEDVAQIVSSASSQLSAQIEHSERGASEQAMRVTETATAMEEMNSTVLEVAKNAGEAADVSTATRERAMAGATVVEQAVKSIQYVQQQSLALKQDMELLGTNARSIDQIMGVISDIADQTNLLALNAAIEAARAGDAGRGFAVVADEVRKLAEKTMASTTDVGNAIRAIQQSATKSMSQVDNAVTTIEEATELANKSGEVLQEIVSMVDRTADQVRAIATASEQQSSSSEEINQSINKVNVIAGETARAMGEATQAVSELSRQAQILTTLIEDMKRG